MSTSILQGVMQGVIGNEWVNPLDVLASWFRFEEPTRGAQHDDPQPKSLRDDNRGAVMLIGLFMATFLIGSMWFMKGVGDAMVFKDRMQEGADHAAFSGAAVNARGMNLIAIINLIMYVLVIIHCVLAILKGAALVCSFIPPVIPFCKAAHTVLDKAQTIYDNTVIRFGLPALSIAGTAAAVGYPWYGSYAGFNVGSDYNTLAVAAGASNVPGLSFSLPLGKLFPSGKAPAGGNLNMGGLLSRSGSAKNKPNAAKFSSDMKLGLPVILVENKYLCERAVKVVSSLAPPGLSTLLDWIGGVATECDGGVWDQKKFGWKRMYAPAANGSDWMQEWSFSFPKSYDEGNAESKVALAQGPKKGIPLAQSLKGQNPSPPMYFAQSEFYYDCEEKWDDEKCSKDDNAVFNMRWTSRMRKVASPDFLGMIMGVLGANLIGPLLDFGTDALTDQLNNSKLVRDASAALGKKGKSLGMGEQGTGALGELISQQEKAVQDKYNEAINKAMGGAVGKAAAGVLH